MPGVRSRQLDEAFRAGRTLRWLRHGSALGKSLELQQQGLREQRVHPCGIEPGGDAGCSQEGATGRAATARLRKRGQSPAYCTDGRSTGPLPCLRGSCVRAAVRLGTDACRCGRLCICWRCRFDPLRAHRRAPAGCHGRRPTVAAGSLRTIARGRAFFRDGGGWEPSSPARPRTSTRRSSVIRSTGRQPRQTVLETLDRRRNGDV